MASDILGRLSVNVDFVYGGRDYREAIRELAGMGFNRMEVVFLKEKSFDELRALQKELGIQYELLMTDFIPWMSGEGEDAFVESGKLRAKQAAEMGCKKVAYFTDDVVPGMSHEETLQRIQRCAERMLPAFEQEGVMLLLEPINNTVDHPNTTLWDLYESLDMLRRVNSPSFRMLFDIYHMQIMHGDVTRHMLENLDLIAHVHSAGNPGRNEIFLGELDYPHIFEALQAGGYTGAFGLEYSPTMPQAEGLEKIRTMFA